MTGQRVQETITAGVAGAGITLPWWIELISGWAATGVPILGFIWLAIQIYYKIRNNKNVNDTTRKEKDS